METATVHQVCQLVYPSFKQLYLQKFNGMSHWSGLDEASGFCYTINTKATPGLLSDILFLPCAMEIHSFDSAGTRLSHTLSIFRQGRCWGELPQSLGSGPEWSQSFGQSTYSPMYEPSGSASSTPLLRLGQGSMKFNWQTIHKELHIPGTGVLFRCVCCLTEALFPHYGVIPTFGNESPTPVIPCQLPHL